MSDEKTKPDQVFVVQRERELLLQDTGDKTRVAWIDIATVTIPANTPRRIALKKALEGFEVDDNLPPKLRALDAKSAEVHEPEAHQPPLEWRL